MDERSDRIIQVAIELAERDGYDAVRLRDVASRANVALGTVYRRFSCKEDILAAALDIFITVVYQGIQDHPIDGETGEQRLDRLFEQTTQLMAMRPKLSAAMLRTVACGVPDLAERVTRYHGTTTKLILLVYRGVSVDDQPPTERERTFAVLLQNVWFAALVGWTGGLHGPEVVIEQVHTATRWLLCGMES